MATRQSPNAAIALMWEGARGLAEMDRDIRAGNWLRDDAMQLTARRSA